MNRCVQPLDCCESNRPSYLEDATLLKLEQRQECSPSVCTRVTSHNSWQLHHHKVWQELCNHTPMFTRKWNCKNSALSVTVVQVNFKSYIVVSYTLLLLKQKQNNIEMFTVPTWNGSVWFSFYQVQNLLKSIPFWNSLRDSKWWDDSTERMSTKLCMAVFPGIAEVE